MRRGGGRALAVVGVVVAALAGGVGLAGCKGKAPRDAVVPRATAVLRLGLTTPSTLDPAKARTLDEQLLADQLFDSLVAWDPATLAPVPSVAESWTSTADQEHWDFTLRPGATFADGSALTSSDVKYTLDRIATMGRDSSVADLLEPVSGYHAVAVDKSAPELSGVTAPTPTTVHIDLDSPMAELPTVLANPSFGIVSRAAVDAAVAAAGGDPSAAFAATFVGSGPFRLTSRAGDALTLVPGAARSTKVGRIDVSLFADKAASYGAFVAGRVDWSEVPADKVKEAATRFGRSAFAPYVAELFYAFNLRSPTFADPRLRAAIVHAVDAGSILRDVYAGTVQPMTRLVMDPPITAAPGVACGEPCAFDVAKAKDLLGQITAGGGSLPAIQVDFDDDRTQTAVAQAIQRDLQAVGLQVELRPKPLADYQQFAVSGDQQLFRLGWIAAYPSPDGVLTPLFRSDSANNVVGLASPDVDTLLSQARSAADAFSRQRLYGQVETSVLGQSIVVPVGRFEVQSVVAERVRGLRVSGMGSFDASRVWLVKR